MWFGGTVLLPSLLSPSRGTLPLASCYSLCALLVLASRSGVVRLSPYHTHARTHARTHTRTPTRTHARPHARTHAHTHHRSRSCAHSCHYSLVAEMCVVPMSANRFFGSPRLQAEGEKAERLSQPDLLALPLAALNPQLPHLDSSFTTTSNSSNQVDRLFLLPSPACSVPPCVFVYARLFFCSSCSELALSLIGVECSFQLVFHVIPFLPNLACRSGCYCCL